MRDFPHVEDEELAQIAQSHFAHSDSAVHALVEQTEMISAALKHAQKESEIKVLRELIDEATKIVSLYKESVSVRKYDEAEVDVLRQLEGVLDGLEGAAFRRLSYVRRQSILRSPSSEIRKLLFASHRLRNKVFEALAKDASLNGISGKGQGVQDSNPLESTRSRLETERRILDIVVQESTRVHGELDHYERSNNTKLVVLGILLGLALSIILNLNLASLNLDNIPMFDRIGVAIGIHTGLFLLLAVLLITIVVGIALIVLLISRSNAIGLSRYLSARRKANRR